MKGLLTKDLILLRIQSRSVLIVVICGIFMAFAFGPSIMIGYIGIIGTMTAIGTLSYDEFDNGFSWLFTLPFKRETFVREKYLFTLLTSCAMIFIGSLIAAVIMAVQGAADIPYEVFMTALTMLFTVMLFTSVLLPIRLKYGSEKARTITYIIYAAILLFVFLGGKALSLIGVDPSAAAESASKLNPDLLLWIFVLAAALFTLISEKISEGIIRKKEF